MFIEVSIILARAKSSILFLNEEEGGGLGQLGFSDFARFEMLINELFTSVHLFWVQRIGLGYFREEGILEVDGMVKQSLRREFSCLGFLKHLGVLGVLRRVL